MQWVLCVPAKHDRFTDEELDFIINYDITYRMGQSSKEGEELMAISRMYADTAVFGKGFNEEFRDTSRTFFEQVREGNFMGDLGARSGGNRSCAPSSPSE